MPFKNSKQRAYLYANKPEVAKRWTAKYGSKIVKKKKPSKKNYSHETIAMARRMK